MHSYSKCNYKTVHLLIIGTILSTDCLIMFQCSSVHVTIVFIQFYLFIGILGVTLPHITSYLFARPASYECPASRTPRWGTRVQRQELWARRRPTTEIVPWLSFQTQQSSLPSPKRDRYCRGHLLCGFRVTTASRVVVATSLEEGALEMTPASGSFLPCSLISFFPRQQQNFGLVFLHCLQ
jgi:hypothetical protein